MKFFQVKTTKSKISHEINLRYNEINCYHLGTVACRACVWPQDGRKQVTQLTPCAQLQNTLRRPHVASGPSRLYNSTFARLSAQKFDYFS